MRMNSLLLRVEVNAIGVRTAVANQCPTGTSGRIYCQRHRRRFHESRRPASATSSSIDKSNLPRNDNTATTFPNGAAPHAGLGKFEYLKSINDNPLQYIFGAAGREARKVEEADQDNLIAKGGADRPILKKQYESVWKDRRDCISTSDELYAALRTGDPRKILETVVNLSRAEKIDVDIGSLPGTMFSEILRCLNPSTLTRGYTSLFSEISPHNPIYADLQPARKDGLYKHAAVFMSDLRSILSVRTNRGYELSLADCKHLLHCARAVGDIDAAEVIWKIMQTQGLDYDTECYNHYFAVKVWADATKCHHRMTLQVTPDHLAMRQWKVLPANLGYRVGRGGLKTEISQEFSEMVSNGIVGDEETFCLMIIAQGREGDMDSVKSILKRVWKVDVDVLLRTDQPQRTPKAKVFPPDSPFRPSRTLLMTIAHTFGTNNQIPAALQIIDYLSQQYQIPIPSAVWEELLERTFILHCHKSAWQIEKGLGAGYLPKVAVENLWNTMVSEPYNIKPNMAMYDKVISSSMRAQRFEDANTRMLEALELHQKKVFDYRQLEQRYLMTYGKHRRAFHNTRLHHERVLAYMAMHRSRQYIRRWVRKWLIRTRYALRKKPKFHTEGVPKFLKEWMSFAPRKVQLQYETGIGTFATQTKLLNRQTSQAQFRKGIARAQAHPAHLGLRRLH